MVLFLKAKCVLVKFHDMLLCSCVVCIHVDIHYNIICSVLL